MREKTRLKKGMRVRLKLAPEVTWKDNYSKKQLRGKVVLIEGIRCGGTWAIVRDATSAYPILRAWCDTHELEAVTHEGEATEVF